MKTFSVAVAAMVVLEMLALAALQWPGVSQAQGGQAAAQTTPASPDAGQPGNQPCSGILGEPNVCPS
jgi:hypothetical protein